MLRHKKSPRSETYEMSNKEANEKKFTNHMHAQDICTIYQNWLRTYKTKNRINNYFLFHYLVFGLNKWTIIAEDPDKCLQDFCTETWHHK